MTVTSLPSRDQTEPISTPMYPPPTMRRCSGTLSRSSASVLDRMFVPSNSKPLISIGEEPVAMRTFFAAYALPSTSTPPPLTSLPRPWRCVTLFFLKRKPMPPVILLTTPCLKPIIFVKSRLTPETPMPRLASSVMLA